MNEYSKIQNTTFFLIDHFTPLLLEINATSSF